MRYFRILGVSILFITVLFTFSSTAFGQTVTISPSELTYHEFLVADLALEGGGRGVRDFTISFGGVTGDSRQITVEVWDRNTGHRLLSGSTDLALYSTIVAGSPYFIGDLDDRFGGEFDLEEAGKELYDKVFEMNELPRGRFRIIVGVSGSVASDFIDINVAPPYIHQLYPVEVQTHRAVLDFRWISNYNRQELHIYTDPFGNDEVLRGSRLPYRNIPDPTAIWYPRAQQVRGSNFTPVLEDGKVYFWKIEGYLTTSHGKVREESQLVKFQYFEEAGKMEYIGLTDADKQAIKDALIEMLKKVVGKREARSIERYDVNSILFDNTPITRYEIMTILQAIIDEELTATTIRFQ